MKATYTKKAFKAPEMLAKMEARGLALDGDARNALFTAFRQIGYYRLTGFCLPFQPRKGVFAPGTTVDQILRLYEFDTALRALCGKALEKLEVCIRVSICDYMARTHDPHWYTVAEHFTKGDFEKSLEKAADCVEFDLRSGKAKELSAKMPRFLKHYYAKYSKPKMPPCWMLSECASFSYWSVRYKSLPQAAKQGIAASWLFPDNKPLQARILADWLWSLSVFRNRCAHHAKITHMPFPFPPPVPRENKVQALFKRKTTDLSSLLLVLALLLRSCAPKYRWCDELKALFAQYEDLDLPKATGVGSNDGDWKNDPIWTL